MTRCTDDLMHRLVRDHPLYFGGVSIAYHGSAAELALPLGVFGSKNMALKGLAALNFAGGSFLEALGCAFMSFQFRHISIKPFCKIFRFASIRVDSRLSSGLLARG